MPAATTPAPQPRRSARSRRPPPRQPSAAAGARPVIRAGPRTRAGTVADSRPPSPPMKRRPVARSRNLRPLAAAQARAERGGARAVGERRQAGQAAAEEAARRRRRPHARRVEAAQRCRANPRRRRQPTGIAPAAASRQSRHRRRWRRSAAASARNCRAAESEIDARLDLHGMTQTRAHRALFGFLQRAHHDGLTFVLVITGKGKVGARIRARRAAPPGAAMAEPAGIPLAGGRLRGSPYRPWRRGRALCAGPAVARLNLQNGRTIPTRGISVTIQPKMLVLRSSAEIGGVVLRRRQRLHRMQDQEQADRPVRNPARIIEHDREHDEIAEADAR